MLKHRQKAVLCIGNDPVSLNLRCSLLKEHGWNALSAGSGHEGVIRFGQETVDAVSSIWTTTARKLPSSPGNSRGCVQRCPSSLS